MSGVEFVPQGDDDEPNGPRHGPPRPPRTSTLRRVPRRVVMVGGAVVAAAVVAAVVVSQRPTAQRPAAAPSHSAAAHSRAATTGPATTGPAPSPSVSTLDLPEQLAFGPQTTSVYAVGNRIYGLTSRLVGAVERDGGELVVRPTTAGLVTGTPTLFLELHYAMLWTVAIGGTSIGSFDTEDLSTRDDQTAPAPIRAAAANLDELWFVTAKGLYRIAPGAHAATLVSAQRGLVAVAADPTRHRMLALGRGGVEAFATNGVAGLRAPLPFQHADDVTVADGQIWIAGHHDGDGLLFHVDPATLRPLGPAPVNGATGGPRVLATFGNRVVVSGIGAAHTMSCLDAGTGTVLQTWSYRRGAVALNDRGLLLSRGYGIEKLAARDCLVGAS